LGGIKVTPHFLVNEVFMAFFFGIAAKEVCEAIMKPEGSLRGVKGILPVIGCIGGVVGPIYVYLYLSTPALKGAWGVPCATDIAFAWLGARMIWGPKHPAVVFLLILAIVDDVIGMGIIAVAYPQHEFSLFGILILAIGMLVAHAMRIKSLPRARSVFRSWIPYMAPGALCWFGLYAAGLHSALALVFVVPFMPMRGRDKGIFAYHESETVHDTVNKFAHSVEPLVASGLFYFGLANAGVAWFGTSAWTDDSWAVFLGLGIGKLVGICTLTAAGYWAMYWLCRIGALKINGQLTLGYNSETGQQMRWYDMPSIGSLAGVGFTVALFVADAAGGHASLKLGALASFAFMGLGFVLHWLIQYFVEGSRAFKKVEVEPVGRGNTLKINGKRR
jgi:NhaA family Na+:H+ antiporter